MSSTASSAEKKDFRRLRDEGHARGVSRAIGQGFVSARNAWARGLIAIGVTPNMLTLFGFLLTCGTAWCLLRGGSHTHAADRAAGGPPWMLLAFIGLFFAFACDMLDGAVARIGKQSTPLGAVLDSSLDRFSDLVLFVALIGHFAYLNNVTYTILSALALSNAFLISYVKARSETMIPDCTVGYWLRGERSAALFIACGAGTIPAVLWQQATLTAFTVLRRLVWTHQVLTAQARGLPMPSNVPAPGWRGLLKPWRYPRGSIPYDLVTGTNIAFIIFGANLSRVFGPNEDPIRAWLTR